MTKKELIAKVAKKTKVTKVDTAMMLDAILEEIVLCLERGDSIRLWQLGSFVPYVVESHECQLFKGMILPDQKRVKLKISKELKDRLNPKDPLELVGERD